MCYKTGISPSHTHTDVFTLQFMMNEAHTKPNCKIKTDISVSTDVDVNGHARRSFRWQGSEENSAVNRHVSLSQKITL